MRRADLIIATWTLVAISCQTAAAYASDGAPSDPSAGSNADGVTAALADAGQALSPTRAWWPKRLMMAAHSWWPYSVQPMPPTHSGSP